MEDFQRETETLQGEEPELIEPGRDRLGRFTKGNNFRPPTAHRKKRPDVGPLLEALQDEFPPHVVVERFRLIFKEGSPKVQLDALKLLLDRLYGKPVAGKISTTLSADDLARLFLDPGPHLSEAGGESDGDDTVDGDFRQIDDA